MIKILHIIDSLGYGGAEKLLYYNLQHIDKKRFSNAVAFLMPRDDLKPQIERLGIPVYSIGLRSRIQFARGISRLSALIKEFSPDIVHTNCWASNVLGRVAGKLNGVKTVISSLHNVYYEKESFIDAPQYTYPKFLFDKALDMITARFCTQKFVAVSEHVKEIAVKQFKVAPENIKVIYNSIDTEYFTPGSEKFDRQEFLNRLGIEGNPPVILSVGRLVPQKGHKYMIRAMAGVAKEIPDAKLVLCGDGWMKGRLKQLSRELGIENNIIFAGSRNDVRKIYEICDIFLFTSLFEGFGIVICEAMAMSKPVVTFRQPPLTEIISSADAGVLVEPGDTVQIAQAIVKLLRERPLCDDMGRRARQEVCSKFDVRLKTEELESFYSGLVRAE